jgi:hypothetical protein
MSLLEHLQELRSSRAIITKQRLPTFSQVERAAQRVEQKYDQIAPTTQIDYDGLISRLRTLSLSGHLSRLSPREIRLGASCLFEGRPALADDAVFLDNFLNLARSINSRITVKRLIHAYCLHFDRSHPAIKRIADFLKDVISAYVGRSGQDWRTRHLEYQIFDPNVAPERLAKLAINSANPRTELEKIGLRGQLLASGLSAAVFMQGLTLLRQNLESHPKLADVERLINWVRADNGSIYYSAYRGSFANALLLPWSRQIPEEAIRQKIQSFLLDNLSDPRVDAGAWIGVDPVARDVMIRWLAQATLEQFLRVVDSVAERQQWNYRRAFWTAYIDRRVVSNAWVVFGTNGAQFARRLADSSADSLMRRFGTLGGAGADQAVLLLHIGNLIIADWSHNGRLRIWLHRNPNAPQFSSQSYLASDLRTGSDFDTVHLPPDGWQSKAEAYIRRHTGIRLDRPDYMPRRSGKR